MDEPKKPHSEGNHEQEHDNQQSPSASQEPPKVSSIYYSYGPFKSKEQDTILQSSNLMDQMTSSTTQEVEIISPHKIMTTHQEEPQQRVIKKSKVSFFRSNLVAGFLVGALFVGGLMFAWDRSQGFDHQNAVSANGTSSLAKENQEGNSIALSQSNPSSPIISNGSTSYEVVRPNHIADMVRKASPAVVKVEAYARVQNTSRFGSSLLDDPFFRYFFGDQMPSTPNNSNNNGALRQTGMGTGFIFDKSGYILTNEHVISGAEEIRVTVEGYDKPFTAELLGNSYDLDLAVLKISGDQEFAMLPLGSTDNINVGDWVVAIGNPYGFEHTVTVGVLSAKERPISIQDNNGTRNYEHLLQTDASINPGNSGGPLLNLAGEVIGINTAVSAQAQGIGFAIPTSTIASVLDNLKNNIEIPKEPAPYIGVSLQDIDQDWVSDLKLENTEGALINAVERRSPAFNAGLRPYDVIIEINNGKIKSSEEVSSKIKTFRVGEKITLGVIRNGERLNLTVEIGDRNQN